MRFERHEGASVSGFSWALVLRDIALDDVPVGSIVTSEEDRSSST
jgi:hypothetical protein